MTEPHEGNQQKIVVGVDGSPSSKGALRWAVRQAQLTASAVEAVTAWEYPELLSPLPADFNPEKRARRLLDSVIEEVVGAHPARRGAPGRDRGASRSGTRRRFEGRLASRRRKPGTR